MSIARPHLSRHLVYRGQLNCGQVTWIHHAPCTIERMMLEVGDKVCTSHGIEGKVQTVVDDGAQVVITIMIDGCPAGRMPYPAVELTKITEYSYKARPPA